MRARGGVVSVRGREEDKRRDKWLGWLAECTSEKEEGRMARDETP